MKDQKLYEFVLCSSIVLLLGGVEFVHCFPRQSGSKKLFVFGDSYADIGNARNPSARSWKEPYGVTFPGKPSGQFSDGRVFIDFLAKSLGLKSSIPYILTTLKGGGRLNYGVNMAFAGSGVFDTEAPYPNMTTQINLFQELLDKGIFTSEDLSHSMAYVSLVGNDYFYNLVNGASIQGLQAFIPQVVNQLVLNIQRIYEMGVTEIFVMGLPPLGCLPRNTYSMNYQQCNSEFNNITLLHNRLLQQTLSKLYSYSTPQMSITILDLYKTFSSIIQPSLVALRDSVFSNLLMPCCRGINSTYSCGSVDINGNKMYTVCKNPRSYFFWDSLHPTQAGWTKLTTALKPFFTWQLYGV